MIKLTINPVDDETPAQAVPVLLAAVGGALSASDMLPHPGGRLDGTERDSVNTLEMQQKVST